jgi:hypothetical protein
MQTSLYTRLLLRVIAEPTVGALTGAVRVRGTHLAVARLGGHDLAASAFKATNTGARACGNVTVAVATAWT